MKRTVMVSGWSILIFCLSVGMAIADKSSVAIEASPSAQKGTELIIRITVTHSANTASHHTEWLKVTVNQKEVARWDYTSNHLPEGAIFTKEIKLKAIDHMEITAQASCNRHGSKGPVTVKVTVKE